MKNYSIFVLGLGWWTGKCGDNGAILTNAFTLRDSFTLNEAIAFQAWFRTCGDFQPDDVVIRDNILGRRIYQSDLDYARENGIE